MHITLDRAGRAVLPKPIREQLHLSAGDTLEVTIEEGRVVLSPRTTALPLSKERGVWVFKSGVPLAQSDTQAVVRRSRERHISPA